MLIFSSKLKVEFAKESEVYTDTIRVNKFDRKNRKGEIIREGTLCKVGVSGTTREVYAFLRGNNDTNGGNIQIDEYLREELGICKQETYEFIFEKAGFFGSIKWSWNATNPAFRVNSRIAIVSFSISMIFAALTILPMIDDIYKIIR